MSLWPSASDCDTMAGAHPNMAVARHRSRTGRVRVIRSMRASEPIQAAASTALNRMPAARTLLPATSMTIAEAMPHSGPYDMTIGK